MQAVAFAVALRPGEADAVRVALASCWSGARTEAYQDARRRAGIIREAVWIQPVPGGDVAVVYLEDGDLAAAFTLLGTSAEPFGHWFRGHAGQAHGLARMTGSPRPSWCSTTTSAESDPGQERKRYVGTAHQDAIEARRRHRGAG